MTREWDVGLRSAGTQADTLIVSIPTELGRSLRERGYTRVRIRVVADGLLLVPHDGSMPPPSAELPESWQR